MTNRFPIALVSAAGMALIPVVAPAAERAGVWTLRQDALGAPARFIVIADSDADAAAAVSAALAEIERLDLVFDTRKPGSEISRLNRASTMTVSSGLFAVLEQAEAMRIASDGAYNGGLGDVLRLWRDAGAVPPSAETLQIAASEAQAGITLDRETLTVTRPKGVVFALDGLAKGYIVDAALAAGLAAAPVRGMTVDIGGDMACQGLAPNGRFWEVGIPDPAPGHAAAPLVATAHLKDRAIATSGRGPRDRLIGGERYSVTVSPRTGWASKQNIAATVVAGSAAQADALATALLVMDPGEGLDLAARMGADARITDAAGSAHHTEGWTRIASEGPARMVCAPAPQAPTAARWNADWAVEILYSAPDRAVNNREPDFRPPYMAMWITDGANRPVRTLVLVGKEEKWQRDNFIWWGMYRDKAPRLVELRSTATALSGAYPTYWPGYNDDWKFIQQGEYILHIETSRERGKHTYRTVKIVLGKDGFRTVVPKTEEGGGLQLVYGKRD